MTTDIKPYPSPPVSPGRLWFDLSAGPVIWAIHLVVAFALVAVSCEWGIFPFTVLGIDGSRFILLILTLVAGLGILAGALFSYRDWQDLRRRSHANGEEPLGRFRFMARSGALLGGIFFVAAVVSIVPILVLSACS